MLRKRYGRVFAVAGLAAVVLLALLVFATGRARPRPPLPNPNGYDDFLTAATLLTGEVNNASTLDHDSLRVLISTNSRALALLRLGLARTCSVPTDAAMSNVPRLLGDLANLKSLARLLEEEGRLAELEHRYGDAARSYLDAIRFGNEISRGGFIISRLVGVACEAIGFSPLAKLAPKLTREETRSVVVALEQIDATRVSWEEVRRNESSFSRYQIGKGFNILTWVTSRWQAWRSIRQAAVRHKRVMAHERLLTTELALRSCQTDKGRPPAHLAELVPNYLSRVAKDPFSGRPLIYRPQGTNWLLYSVGQDGVDDGGQPAARGLAAKGDILFDSPW